MLYWFQKLCQWLESEADAELYTLMELHAKISAFSDGAEVYTTKRLKQKLHEHYKDHIFFAEIEGSSNVLCFRNMANYIVNERWQSEKKEDSGDEMERIVVAAAKIIRAEIREKLIIITLTLPMKTSEVLIRTNGSLIICRHF